jgi:hypothetical protein
MLKLTPYSALAVAALACGTFSAQIASAQIAVPPRVGNQPSLGNQGLRQNVIQSTKAVAMTNHITIPKPLLAQERDNALAEIDRHVREEFKALDQKLMKLLPDELAILAKTAGWATENQQKLVAALRANDPAAVFEAWSRGSPQDGTGAEIAARQTDVRKILAQLRLEVEKNPAAAGATFDMLDEALVKITAATPGVLELNGSVDTFQTWAQARHLIDTAVVGKGSSATLPTGRISLVYDPSLAVGTAIVLSDKALLIGNQGRGPLKIETGIAAAALGLPIVTGDALADAQGQEAASGVLLRNTAGSLGTINYNVDGSHYVMEPGMFQKLPENRNWHLEFDRGGGFGPAQYTLSPGTYHFTPSDQGWQVFRARFDIVVDNTQNPQEFHFIHDGEVMTVPANGTRKVASDYPIVLRYDRGNDSELAAKIVRESGNIQVGVNATDNRWDLFPTVDNAREVTGLRPFEQR